MRGRVKSRSETAAMAMRPAGEATSVARRTSVRTTPGQLRAISSICGSSGVAERVAVRLGAEM